MSKKRLIFEFNLNLRKLRALRETWIKRQSLSTKMWTKADNYAHLIWVNESEKEI